MAIQANASRADTENPMRRHQWEMVSGFILSLPEQRERVNECVLAPLAAALAPFGLSDDLLCRISGEVEQAGDDLRGCCPEGSLECINVRVQVSIQALRSKTAPAAWSYFLVKEMASSESDNLSMLEKPICFIDLHVYPQEG